MHQIVHSQVEGISNFNKSEAFNELLCLLIVRKESGLLDFIDAI